MSVVNLKRISLLLVVVLTVLMWGLTASSQVRSEGSAHGQDAHVEARLIANVEQVAVGESFLVGVALTIRDDWHIYGENPGDAGMPTDLRFEAEGVEFGPLMWAAPDRFIEEGVLTTFGYGDEVVLFRTAVVREPKVEVIEIAAAVDYLACRDLCVPGHAGMELALPVGQTSMPAPPEDKARFEHAVGRLPQRSSAAGLAMRVHLDREPLRVGDRFSGVIEVIDCEVESGEGAGGTCSDWSPAEANERYAFLVDGYSALEVRTVQGDAHPGVHRGWLLRVEGQVRAKEAAAQGLLSGVVEMIDGAGERIPVHFRQELPIAESTAPQNLLAIAEHLLVEPSAALAAPSPDVEATMPAPPMEVTSVLWMLFAAFVGGMILNLMPCVFPVLVLKVSSFATLAHEDRSTVVRHGFAYSAGILLSMLTLALVVAGLRLTGTQVGWGFQFQQPYFLVALILLLTAFSLNMFGVYEITFNSQTLTTQASEAKGTRRSFFEGVLAVILATPCSAPFMGAAIGFALTGSIPTIFAIFLALGLGLAAPMVVLALIPGWARLMPAPGQWMVNLKVFLGFALMGSALWIAWILGRLVGIDGAAQAMMLALALALFAWLYGLVQWDGWTRRRIATITLGAVVLGATAWYALPIRVAPRAGIVAGASEIAWQEWSDDAVERELAAGRPVFVDFTADWCITCKVNKKNAIETPLVVEASKEFNVAMLRADWTQENEDIRLKLEEFQRAGIPFYLVYSPEDPKNPEMLAEVITSRDLVRAFRKAAQ